MMTIEQGELRVRFQTLDELAMAVVYRMTVFIHDLDRLYEAAPKINEEDVQALNEAQSKADFTETSHQSSYMPTV
jgi:hypothetical protein